MKPREDCGGDCGRCLRCLEREQQERCLEREQQEAVMPDPAPTDGLETAIQAVLDSDGPLVSFRVEIAAAVRVWLQGRMPAYGSSPKTEYDKGYDRAIQHVKTSLGLDAEQEKA